MNEILKVKDWKNKKDSPVFHIPFFDVSALMSRTAIKSINGQIIGYSGRRSAVVDSVTGKADIQYEPNFVQEDFYFGIKSTEE